jgi:hypothetical protein
MAGGLLLGWNLPSDFGSIFPAPAAHEHGLRCCGRERVLIRSRADFSNGGLARPIPRGRCRSFLLDLGILGAPQFLKPVGHIGLHLAQSRLAPPNTVFGLILSFIPGRAIVLCACYFDLSKMNLPWLTIHGWIFLCGAFAGADSLIVQ